MQCPIKTLVVEIPDLEANQVEGIQCWRADQETSEYLYQSVQISFGDFSVDGGTEMMKYTMVNAQGETVASYNPAVVVRGERENDPVKLHFVFSNWSEAPGWIRVRTFNAVGESDLSEEAAFLWQQGCQRSYVELRAPAGEASRVLPPRARTQTATRLRFAPPSTRTRMSS